MDEHALYTPRSATGIALAAVVLSLGEPFMPPSCFYFIVGGCYLAVAAIVWLCWKEIRLIIASLRDKAKTMKIPADFYVTIGLGVIAFIVPTIMLIRGPEAQAAQPAASSTGQNGGQTGGIINNYGPSYNGAVVPPRMGDNNTVVGTTTPANMGSGNTIVGPTDPNGNTIYNKGGTAIGAGACADSATVAIGAGAGAGLCAHH